MRNIVPILVMALSTPWMPAYACSCMGNNSYCESLSPTWWVNPDATALVVKLTDYHYGITVKVVEVIGDGSLPVSYTHLGCSGRMTDLQFVRGSQEFAAIPEARRGFNGRYIGPSGHEEHQPAGDDVQFLIVHTGGGRMR